jgi:hypothetical protein
VLSGNFFDVVRVDPVPAPWSYVILFGATGPAMLLSAGLVWLAVLPPAPEPKAGARLAEALRGVRQFFLSPLILVAVAGFLLTYGGTMIMPNLSLFAQDAIGEAPERYAGLQLALRFGFKSLSGFALGWLVARAHAKVSLLVTTAFGMGGVCWALAVPGKWYLLSFGFIGAGELFYVYYLNYIVGCSPPGRIRENTAYTNLFAGLALGPVPLVYGRVAELHGRPASFGVALGVFAAALLVVWLGLPRQPRVHDEGPPS